MNRQGWRAEVVAQASFSWTFGPIHLLAPYGDERPVHSNGPAAPRRCNSLQGPLRQRLTALPLPLKGEAGWVVQMAAVVTRTREILRFAQDDKRSTGAAQKVAATLYKDLSVSA